MTSGVHGCRLGEGDADSSTALEAAWSQEWGAGPNHGMLAAALGAAEARASSVDLENARLRLALVRCCVPLTLHVP